MSYWEDRLSAQDRNKVHTAIASFRDSGKSRLSQDECFDILTNSGLTDEEADEMINIELSDG